MRNQRVADKEKRITEKRICYNDDFLQVCRFSNQSTSNGQPFADPTSITMFKKMCPTPCCLVIRHSVKRQAAFSNQINLNIVILISPLGEMVVSLGFGKTLRKSAEMLTNVELLALNFKFEEDCVELCRNKQKCFTFLYEQRTTPRRAVALQKS